MWAFALALPLQNSVIGCLSAQFPIARFPGRGEGGACRDTAGYHGCETDPDWNITHKVIPENDIGTLRE